MKRYLSLLPILAVPGVIAIYAMLFWNSVKGMAIESAGYPKLLIGAIACLLPFVVWREVADRRRAGAAEISFAAFWLRWHKVVYAAVALVAYVLLMSPLGIYLSSALFVGGLTYMLGYRRPTVLATLVAGALLVVFVFARFLGVDLPGT